MKRITGVFVGFLLVVLVATQIVSATSRTEQLYPTAGTITRLDVENDSVYVETYGAEYSIEGIEDWSVGDNIAMIMSDNGTDKIADDIVIDYRYVVIP